MHFFRELDRVSQRYPDDDPDFMSVISGSQQQRSRARGLSMTPSTIPSIAEQSNVLSAATTSRLYETTRPNPKTQVWDVGARRWKHRRPIGRPAGIQQAIQAETETMGSSNLEARTRTFLRPELGSHTSSRKSRPPIRSTASRGMSEVASSILTTEEHDNPGQRVIIDMAHRRGRSISSGSAFPSLVDDISPNDAADAGDPGRVNSFEQAEDIEITVCCGPAALWTPRVILMAIDGLVDLAEPDTEMKRIITLGLPLTLGAMSEPVFKAVTVGFISNYVGTDAMVAFVIVNLLIGFTDELVGAVSDAENTLCSYALSTGQLFLAGQYVQISIVTHSIFSVPLLVMWALTMEDIVFWFIKSESTALLAKKYSTIIVFHHFLQSMSRIFTVLFQLTGNELFETRFGLGESIITVVIISIVVAMAHDATLETVAWIQFLIGIAALIAKLGYAIYNRWFRVFHRGLCSYALKNVSAVQALLMASLPLFVGAFLEYGEWEILLFFVPHLGPAEVATWSILGVIWKILESSTEGIGEAAAIRVAYHLGHHNPAMAKLASYKAIFVAAIYSLFVSAMLLMGGTNLSKWLTSDVTLQYLLNDSMTMLGLGNVVMTYGLVTWSLVGAQGRYRLATLVILLARWLVTLPCAIIVVFAFDLDINSVLASLIIGFATAGLALAYVLLRSDWDRLARILQELNAMMESDLESGESSHDGSASDGEEGMEVINTPASIMRSSV